MRLADWRAQEGLSLRDAGKRIGSHMPDGAPVHLRTIHRYETGERTPSAIVVEAIRMATGGAVSPVDMHDTRLEWCRSHDGGDVLKTAEEFGVRAA